MSWSISVKTVGGGTNAGTDDSEQAVSKPKPTDFTVNVEPEDLVTSLYTQIENITGLTKGQQRLIYRGRLLGDASSGRIKDVDGLGDGQTIHLVPKPVEPVAAVSESAVLNNNHVESPLLQSSSDDGGETAVGSASAGILAALLGLGSSNGSSLNDGDNNDDDEGDVEHIFPLPRPRSTRMSTRRRTANVYRRFATDPRYPEPGPIEPVRQSLMTLHTMVGSKPQDVDEEEQQSKCPAHAKRKWYKGQWLDCRDTVNQWLEATVVEIVSPDEILQGANKRLDKEMKGDSLCPSIDPAIGADDMDGRRKLLLESADDKFDSTLSALNNDDNLVGFQERNNNDNIQLLLVHYNGWPRRWDEWMRSDSERIRPFRTRSKHVQSHSHICPTPNSVFENAPSTHITHEDESIDRVALLPELHRSLGSIQDLFGESMQQNNGSVRVKTLTLEEQLDLATAVNKLQADRLTRIRDMFDDSPAGNAKCDDESDIDLTHLDTVSQFKIHRLLQEARERVRSDKRRVEPDNNLPWALCETDSKPKADDDDNHAIQPDSESRSNLRFFDKQKLEALAPMLDRLGRVLIDAAPHVAAIAESLPDKKHGSESSSNNCDESYGSEIESRDSIPEQSDPESATGLFPIQEESQPASSNDDADDTDDTDDMPPLLRRENSDLSDDSSEPNPDYVDFVNGFIHATRNDGSTRAGSVRRGGQNEGSLGSSLFSALLASGNSDAGDDDDDSRNGGGRSGPRLLRVGGGGGGGGGGIDIHIHAIVTGGGGGGGIAGIGLDGLGGLLGPPPSAIALNNPSTSAESRSAEGNVLINPIPSADEDDLGLFSDLYTDNPQPEGTRSITSSTPWNDDIDIPDEVEDVSENDPSSVAPTNDGASSDDSNGSMVIIPPTSEPGHTLSSRTVNSAPPRLANVGSLVSTVNSPQDEPSGNNDQSNAHRPRSTQNEPRRSNSIGRLFRRVLTRRSSNNI